MAQLSAALYAPGTLARSGRCGAIPIWPEPSRSSWRRSARRFAGSHGWAAGGARRVLSWCNRPAHRGVFAASPGLLELDDLATFTTSVETPASVFYRGYEVFKCGPWSQGPVFTATSPARRLRPARSGTQCRSLYPHRDRSVKTGLCGPRGRKTPILCTCRCRAALRHLLRHAAN